MKSCLKHSQKNKTAIAPLYLGATMLFLTALLLGLLLGSTRLQPSDIWEAIVKGADGSAETSIFWYVRIPRTCASLLCGAALAVAGAVIQYVLANRLASPSIIGVNAGAGLAVTLCGAFGILGGWRLSLFAFLGAFLTVMLVSLGAQKWGASRGTVILMGVALNALLGAVADAVIIFFPEVAILGSDFRIGDFSAVTSAKLIPAAVAVLITSLLLFSLSNELDVLTLGDETAKGLGMNVHAMRVLFLMLAALLAGAAVSIAGQLSFVGLLIPHAVRRVAGERAKHLLPLCALFGAGFVSLCDTVARTLFAPYEIPVGMIMSFLGAPFFIWILIKRNGETYNA